MTRGRTHIARLPLLALAGLAIGAGAGTWAAFSSSTSTPANTFSAAPSFGCNASPSTVTAAADTYVDQTSATSAFGTATSLVVRSNRQGGTQRNARALVRFTLPSTPAGCSLESATLTLHTTAGTAGRTIDVFRADASWTESTTWNTQPATAGTEVSAGSVASGAFSVVVTDLVTALYAGTNTGFVLRDSAEGVNNSNINAIVQNYSSREAATAANRPALTLTWN